MTADEVAATNTGDLPSYDWDQAAAHLSRWNDKWDDEDGSNGNGIGTPGTVTYGYLLNAGNEQYPALTAGEIANVEIAFQLWEEVANIDFIRVQDSGSDYIADAGDAEMDVQAKAETNGGWMSGGRSGGEFSYVTLALGEAGLEEIGSWAFSTALHEIGHGIGLPHPGNYNGTADETQKDYFEDSAQFTVMSYFDETGTGADYGSGWYWEDVWVRGPWTATGPKLHDIAAAQRLYGENMTTRTGDSVYGWNSNLGHATWSVTDWKQVPIAAIWDAGGIDTIDASGWSVDQSIDLREESFSSIGAYAYGTTAMVNNVSIARGAVIENAVGGGGHDVLIGNAAQNWLDGGQGDDELTGGAGSDTFVFTAGTDTVKDFQAGIDLIDLTGFGSENASVTDENGNAIIMIGDHRMIVENADGADVRIAAGLALPTFEFAGNLEDFSITLASGGLTLVFTNQNIGNGDDQTTELDASVNSVTFAGSVTAVITAEGNGAITAFRAYGADGEVLRKITTNIDGEIRDKTYENGVIARNVIIEADGDVRTTVYDASGQRTSMAFEDLSATRSWENYTNTYDETGARTNYDVVYDSGRTLNRSFENGVTVLNVVTEADGDIRTTVYDASGQRTSMAFEDLSDARNWESYTNTYDATGARTNYDVVYDDGKTLSRSFENGVTVLNVVTEADGDIRTTVYDASGQRTSVVFEDRSDTRSWESYTNTYDETGALLDREYVWDVA